MESVGAELLLLFLPDWYREAGMWRHVAVAACDPAAVASAVVKYNSVRKLADIRARLRGPYVKDAPSSSTPF